MKYKKEDLRCKFVKFYIVVLSQISRTSHFLLIITTMIVLSLSVTPFSIARISSLRKEGKSAVLDYWQFKVLHSALICFTNPASPNFFTGRAGFVLRTHTAHLPKSASWICFALVAVVDFTSLSSTSHSLTELTHFVRVTRPCHCLQIDLNIQNFHFFVTPFFRLRHSSAEKEGKSASWIIGSSKFFTPL